MTRILCFGDLHLGAGADYGRSPGDRLRDQRDVLSMVVQIANEEEVDAVLFAGDAFHRRRPTPSEMLAFARPLDELEAPLIAINGNHDIESADMPSALEVFTNGADHPSPGLLTLSKAPEVVTVAGIAVATLPWTSVSRLVAAQGGGDRDDTNREAAGLLIAAARGLRALIPTGQPAVLMLHWSVSGASTPTGTLTDDFREVVLPIEDLEALGFDTVVCGHIHRHQFPGGPDSRIFYVGSPAPVDFGEEKTEHGCVLVELGGDVYDGFEYQFLPVESRRFVTIDFDAAAGSELGLDETDTAAAAIAAQLPIDDAVIRIRYRATEEQARHIDWPALRPLLDDAHRVYAIQGDISRAGRTRVEGVDEDLAPLDAVRMWALSQDMADIQRIRALQSLTGRLLQEVGK